MQVSADVRVERVVRRDAGTTKVDTKAIVREYAVGIYCNPDAGITWIGCRIRDENAATQIEGDAVITDCVIDRIDVDENTMEIVRYRIIASNIGADEITQNCVERYRLTESEVNTVSPIARDNVAGGGSGATNRIAGRAVFAHRSFMSITQSRRAVGISAYAIALHKIASPAR